MRAHKRGLQQAPLALESGGECCVPGLEERPLGGAANMAAPSEKSVPGLVGVNRLQLEDGQRDVVGQEEPRAYWPGCEAPHVSGGHGVISVHQRFGRPAGGQVPVGVRAPPGHHPEERAQPGAVRLTSRDLASRDGRSLDPILSVHESFLDSRSTMSGVINEEELDYEEETPGSGEQAVAVPQAKTSGQVVQGDRLSGRRDVTAHLCRGAVRREGGVEACEKRREDAVQLVMQQIELGLSAVTISGCVGGPDGCCNVWIVGHSFVRWAEKQATSRHFGKQLGLDGTRIQISWVEVGLFRQDGVHLTFMGNELYLLELRMLIADLLGERLWDH
ncbi:hypothetical protein NDU88_006283 [Pleurodeles waltl]|uniref:Uncharacterized protein n=1 Tax=Pleurodeles waltl TaxID=8319 RepID=A0AAV7SPD0_PLEWA|nr:hypothetical protein NDU88_006283 [Pleurodeles waltl]